MDKMIKWIKNILFPFSYYAGKFRDCGKCGQTQIRVKDPVYVWRNYKIPRDGHNCSCQKNIK